MLVDMLENKKERPAHFLQDEYKVRKAARYGFETTIDPKWVRSVRAEGKKLKHLFDLVYVIVPPHVEVDKEKLHEAIVVKRK